jgi:hypothetical protein
MTEIYIDEMETDQDLDDSVKSGLLDFSATTPVL